MEGEIIDLTAQIPEYAALVITQSNAAVDNVYSKTRAIQDLRAKDFSLYTDERIIRQT